MHSKDLQAETSGRESGVDRSIPSATVPTVMGLNDNLDFMGRQLHVQTENLKSPAMCILTQVFSNGRVVFSTKSEYPPDVLESQDSSRIEGLMRDQHYRVMNKIREQKKNPGSS